MSISMREIGMVRKRDMMCWDDIRIERKWRIHRLKERDSRRHREIIDNKFTSKNTFFLNSCEHKFGPPT